MEESRDFKEQVKKGFQNCKLDIESLREENEFLKEHVKKLIDEIKDMKSEIKGLTIGLDYIKEFNLKAKEQPQSEPIVEEKPQPTKPAQKEKSSENIYSPKGDPYQALLAYKAKANKRDILKQKLTSLVTQNGINLSELKFLFVDHYNYCSKATFYNYLKELELERVLKIERENSKNFVFPYNVIEREI